MRIFAMTKGLCLQQGCIHIPTASREDMEGLPGPLVEPLRHVSESAHRASNVNNLEIRETRIEQDEEVE